LVSTDLQSVIVVWNEGARRLYGESVTSAGFDGYITKPIDPETFMSELARFLPARATIDSAVNEQ
jgi:CheY-like chemotaxis protein